MAMSWNSLEIAKLAVSLMTPLTVAVLGYLFSRRLRAVEVEKEKQREERERKYKSRIELTIECHTYGPQEDSFVAEFIISANNKSLIRHKFKGIVLRVRGIKRGRPLSLWEKHEPRLDFHDKLFEANIACRGVGFHVRRARCKARVHVISRIDMNYRFIVAHAEFRYDASNQHNIERVFEIGN